MKTGCFLVVMMAIVALSACEEPEEAEETRSDLVAEQRALNDRIALWQQAKLSSYQYIYRKQCFCPPEEGIVVVVVDSQVSQAFRTPSGIFLSTQERVNVFTIDQLFEKVQDAINRRVYSLNVSYNSTYHYPELIVIDGNQNLADDEIGYSVSHFQ